MRVGPSTPEFDPRGRGTRDVYTPAHDTALLLPVWGSWRHASSPVPLFLARGRPRRQERFLDAA